MQPIPNEAEVIHQAQQGERKAIATLYEAYAQSIFQYISYRVETDMIAEDLTADVFLRMIRGIKTYRYQGIPFGAWLFRFASNQIKDYYRSQQKQHEIDLPETLSTHDTGPLQNLIAQEERQQIRRALQTLSEDYQNILILRFMQDLPYPVVAEVMERSESALRVLQHRALKALNTALTREEIDGQVRKGEHSDE